MSESIRQQKNPQGLGTGSVPVLFSLRNVQPSIVGGMGKFKTNESQPNKQETTSSVAFVPAEISATSPAPIKSITKSNRPYNIAVGLLILALCLLVLRNTQETKTNAKDTIASSSPQSSPSSHKPVAESKAEMILPPMPNSIVLKPIDLGPSLASLPDSSNTNSIAALPELAKPSNGLDLSPDSVASQDAHEPTGNAPTVTSDDEQLLVKAKPPMLLLPSTKPLHTGETDSASENKDSANHMAQSGIRFPEPRLAANANSRQTNSAFTEPTQPVAEGFPSGDTNLSAGGSGNAIATSSVIVDTSSPSMTTRELIDLHERGKQNIPPNSWNVPSLPGSIAQGVPASPISSVSSVSENYPTSPTSAFQTNNVTDGRMMSGRPYPPLPKEYPALTIPAYEQNALSGRQGLSNPNPTTQLIRQPANGSNRYQSISPQTSTAPIPYTPIAPSQSGNSIGYPPGN